MRFENMPFKMHKKYNFMHFESTPFKSRKIIFSMEKKIIKKCVCLPYLNFSELLPETLLFFCLA